MRSVRSGVDILNKYIFRMHGVNRSMVSVKSIHFICGLTGFRYVYIYFMRSVRSEIFDCWVNIYSELLVSSMESMHEINGQ